MDVVLFFAEEVIGACRKVYIQIDLSQEYFSGVDMHRIHINTSDEYDVIIDKGIIEACGSMVRDAVGGARLLIVSDSNVAALYLEKVSASFAAAGYEVHSFVIPAGESSKNFETLAQLVSAAAEAGLSRSDVIAALGGGVIGDIAGFAASVYMRGVPYVQIPTTLLAAVDSSVGGKTAVDIPAGKNLAGAFYQPGLVICDCEMMDTLSERERNSGFAEVIKYAMIANPAILEMLDGPADDLIAECVRIKADIVGEDEKDTGKRKLLNFGHTFGHALEQASSYEMLHGEAVALGMLMACDTAEGCGCLQAGTKEALAAALGKYGTLSVCWLGDPAELEKYMKLDKKASGDMVDFVMPEALGRCRIERMRIEDIIGAMKDGR